MFSICPLLQHVLSCPHTHFTVSHLGEKLTPIPSPARAFTSPEAPLMQEGRDSNMRKWGQFSGAPARKLPSVCLILFLLNLSTSHIVLHICHNSPWWSFPGLTILLYLLSPYNTAVPQLPYLGCPFPAKPFQGLQRAPWQITKESKESSDTLCKGMQRK